MIEALAVQSTGPQTLKPSQGLPQFLSIGAPDPESLLQAQVNVLGATVLVYMIEATRTAAGWQTFNDASTFGDEEYWHLLELLGDDEEFQTINLNGRDYILLAVPAQREEGD